MDDILTAKDLAQYLKLNERTALRLATEGVLPGAKVGGQWRFKRSAIDRWLDLQFEGQSGGTVTQELGTVSVGEILDADLVVAIDEGMCKSEILSHLVSAGAAAGAIRDPQAVQTALQAREGVCSTGIGHGVALPHARDLSGREVSHAVLVIGRAPGGVEFDALDGEATYLVIVVCAPDATYQMRLLGRLSCLLQRPDLVSALRRAADGEEVVRILADSEAEVFRSGYGVGPLC